MVTKLFPSWREARLADALLVWTYANVTVTEMPKLLISMFQLSPHADAFGGVRLSASSLKGELAAGKRV